MNHKRRKAMTDHVAHVSHVSYETAIRLAAAGFPQPAPEIGQTWYVLYKCRTVMILGVDPAGFVHHTEDGFDHIVVNSYRANASSCPVETWLSDPTAIFAPTATDILRELTPHKILGTAFLWAAAVDTHGTNLKFTIRVTSPVLYQDFEKDNPAEACAAAWLAIHEKTTAASEKIKPPGKISNHPAPHFVTTQTPLRPDLCRISHREPANFHP